MRYRFGLILTMTMVLFAISVSLLIAVTNYVKLREQAIRHKLDQVQQNEEMAKYALETVEKAYNMFGNTIALKMKESTDYLLDLYDRNPSVDQWDFDSLWRIVSADIYMINDQNVITHSTYESDVGLDFKVCCKKLSEVLGQRRASGDFFHDGIDIEQKTGKLKKYSYMATRDKKFLIELGYSLEEGEIFTEFNFLEAIEKYAEQSPFINAIHVLNSGGVPLGEPVRSERKLTPERKKLFELARDTGQPGEVAGEWNLQPAIYRYVQYNSKYDQGTTQTKVLEIIYNENDLRAVLVEYKRTFIIQLTIILMFAVAISVILSKWVAKPFYLAFHDSLTGLRNRASFEGLLDDVLAKNETAALLMIDLDNFKLVNDSLGHDKGDHLLKNTAQCIRSAARKEDFAVRFGGDEFVLIMPAAGKQQAEITANRLIESIVEKASREFETELGDEKVTVSIGIALYPENGMDAEELFKKADLALYASKQMGKNRYRFYSAEGSR